MESRPKMKLVYQETLKGEPLNFSPNEWDLREKEWVFGKNRTDPKETLNNCPFLEDDHCVISLFEDEFYVIKCKSKLKKEAVAFKVPGGKRALLKVGSAIRMGPDLLLYVRHTLDATVSDKMPDPEDWVAVNGMGSATALSGALGDSNPPFLRGGILNLEESIGKSRTEIEPNAFKIEIDKAVAEKGQGVDIKKGKLSSLKAEHIGDHHGTVNFDVGKKHFFYEDNNSPSGSFLFLQDATQIIDPSKASDEIELMDGQILYLGGHLFQVQEF